MMLKEGSSVGVLLMVVTNIIKQRVMVVYRHPYQ